MAAAPTSKQPQETHGHGPEIRRHVIALIPRVLIPGALLAFLWLGAIGAFLAFRDAQGQAPDWSVAAGLGLLVLSLLPTVWLIVVYHDWMNDYLSITRDQIVHYEQHYIYSHRTQAIPLGQVQNVGIYIPNALYRWLNVGHVFIDTAGQEGAIRFTAVRDPLSVQSRIFELLGRSAPVEIIELPSTRFQRIFPVYPLPTARGGMIWHRHWWVLLRRIVLPLALSLSTLVLFVLWLVEGVRVDFSVLPEIGASVAVFLILAWIVASLWVLYVYEDWRNDYWIVTDTHIIDVDALPFISEDRRQARLEDIQDVYTEVPSLFDRLINKGHVFAETAGKAQNFELREVMDPNVIQQEIFRRRTAARARQAEEKAGPDEQEEFERRVLEIVSQRLGIQVSPGPLPDDE